MVLKNNELIKVQGGALTSSILNALTKAMTTILKIGQTIGSVIRRSITRTFCIG